MPEDIDFEGLGDLEDIKESFSKELEIIETSLRKLIDKTEDQFDKKNAQLKVLYRKMYKNYIYMQEVHNRNLQQSLKLEKDAKRKDLSLDKGAALKQK